MIEVFLKGIGLGFVIALAAGPVFINLVNTSVHKGFTAGVFMAFGISLSDIAYILLAYLGLGQFMEKESQYTVWLGYGGGLILISFGLFYLLRSPKIGAAKVNLRSGKTLFREFVKGILINGINPFVLIFWFGLMTFATIENEFSTRQLLVFFAGVVTTVFTTDLLKAYLADKVRRFMNSKTTNIMYKVMGLALMGFGIRMIHYTVTQLS